MMRICTADSLNPNGCDVQDVVMLRHLITVMEMLVHFSPVTHCRLAVKYSNFVMSFTQKKLDQSYTGTTPASRRQFSHSGVC